MTLSSPPPLITSEAIAVTPQLIGAVALIVLIGAAVYFARSHSQRPVQARPLQGFVSEAAPARYAAPPIPDLEEMHLAYADRREREEKRADVRRKLDALQGIASIVRSGDSAPPQPPNA